MIKVFLVSGETRSTRIIALLNESKELQLCEEPASSNVILIHTIRWNRMSLAKYSHFLKTVAPPSVIICDHAEEPFSRDSLYSAHGISGVLSSLATDEQILAGVRAAAAGLKVQHRSPSVKLEPTEDARLTTRELEVLRLIADGEGNKSIAYLLEISEHTVKFHISSIFEKLHVFNRTEAVKAGISTGLISI